MLRKHLGSIEVRKSFASVFFFVNKKIFLAHAKKFVSISDRENGIFSEFDINFFRLLCSNRFRVR